MANRLRILRLEDTAFPIFLLSIPEFGRLSVWIRPRSGAACKIFSLTLLTELVGVLHAAVCRCKLICIGLRILGELAIPRQWRDREFGASCFSLAKPCKVMLDLVTFLVYLKGSGLV